MKNRDCAREEKTYLIAYIAVLDEKKSTVHTSPEYRTHSRLRLRTLEEFQSTPENLEKNSRVQRLSLRVRMRKKEPHASPQSDRELPYRYIVRYAHEREMLRK